ncbi:MAG: pyridoxal phosphate-dependent aminotransferase [Alphaproteobacteria bacterium]|nr:pyridoxal phosphate-dependent aminotransferase [Alphaproteobacteria bacterium]
MRAEGRVVFSLSTPQFPARDLAPMVSGPLNAKLGDPRGQPELRHELVPRLYRHWPHAAAESMVTAGAKAALFLALKSLGRPGEQVAIVAPAWPSYQALADAAGLQSRLVPTSTDDFALWPDSLQRHATTSRLVVLSHPNNPSGRAYSRDEIDALIAWCGKGGRWLILDESFSETVEDAAYFEPRANWPYERLVVVNSMSKNYNLQGIRLGLAVAQQAPIDAMSRLQLGILSPPSRPVQDLVVQMARGGHLQPIDVRAARAATRSFIAKMADWSCVPTSGTFYLFPKVPQLAQRLVRWETEASLFGLPGHHFGDAYAEHLRLCFYRPAAELEEIFSRLCRSS